VPGQAHKKSKTTTQRVLREKQQDSLDGGDHPMQETSESCNHIGFAADES
jgi:hypothetical protein